MEREARKQLAADARHVALQRSSRRLWSYASQPPATFHLADDETGAVLDANCVATPSCPLNLRLCADASAILQPGAYCPLSMPCPPVPMGDPAASLQRI